MSFFQLPKWSGVWATLGTATAVTLCFLNGPLSALAADPNATTAAKSAAPLITTLAATPSGTNAWPIPVTAQGYVFNDIPVDPSKKVIALTFDDGPQPGNTEQILAILAQNNVKATFFQLGSSVSDNPDLALAVRNAGHAIGNHTWSHLESPPVPKEEVQSVNTLFQNLYGSPSGIFRPPFGNFENGVVDAALDQGDAVIIWSVDPKDWDMPGTASIVNTVVSEAAPGGVVLMHDGGGDRSQTIAALPQIISTLRSQGYSFVTIPQLLAMRPGEVAPPVLDDAAFTFTVGRSILGAQLEGTDPNGDKLTYTALETLPNGVTLTPDGIFSGTPRALTPLAGVQVRVSVNDGNGGEDTANVTLKVIDEIKPAIVIDTPTSKQNLLATAFTGITGTASDNGTVAQVFLKLARTRGQITTYWNGSAFTSSTAQVAASLASTGASKTNWSYAVSPALKAALDNGPYVISAYSQDGVGQQSNLMRRDFQIGDGTLPTLSVEDLRIVEGNSGLKPRNFVVRLSSSSYQPITVKYAFGDGTATSGTDYTAQSGSLTFSPGQTSKTIPLSVNGDTLDENDETLQVTLSTPSGATIADGVAVGTILDDDATPSLAITDAVVTEGNSGTVAAATFKVSLSAPSGRIVTVKYQTLGGGSPRARAGDDYIAVLPTMLTFAPGQTSQTINVPIQGDTSDEPDEQFWVKLTGNVNVVNPDGVGVATIVDDDQMPSIAVADVSLRESDSKAISLSFEVKLSAPSGHTVTVQFQTAPGTVNPATAGTDYLARSLSTLTFAPGQTTKRVEIPIQGDKIFEENETFRLLLSSASFSTIADAEAVATILDNDQPPGLSVRDTSVVEGNSSSSTLSFDVQLSAASGRLTTVKYATVKADSLPATAGVDYTPIDAATLTFAPGEVRKTISVIVSGDSLKEDNERVALKLSRPVNATLTKELAHGVILDDDAMPSLSINDVVLPEGSGSAKSARFTVSLSGVSGQTITLAFATANGSAIAGADYQAVTGTLTFAPGQTTKSIVVPIVSDTIPEGDETFSVVLSAVINAGIARNTGTATLKNDDTINAVPATSAAETSARSF